MVNDPLVVALATALEGLLERGIELRPLDGLRGEAGWTIKLAQEQRKSAVPEPEAVGRSW
jgi:hypothetical protein